MSIYDKNNPEYDFICRTKRNLEFIEKRYKQEKEEGKADEDITDVFEATQLINSFVGLLIYPKEKFYDYMYKDFDEDSESYDIIQKLKNDSKRYSNSYHERSCDGTIYEKKEILNARTLALRLRNAIAHANFKAYSKDSKIEGFSFSDKDNFWGIKENNIIKRLKKQEPNSKRVFQSFYIELSIGEIRTILYDLCDLLISHFE